MNIRLYISAIVAIVVLSGCPSEKFVEREIDVDGDLFTSMSRIDTFDRNVHSSMKFNSDEEGFIIAEDQKPCLISDVVKDSNLSMERDTFKLSIVTSQSILDSADMHVHWTNSLLHSMNVGFVIDTVFDTVVLDNIDSLNTNGRLNTDNIISELNSFLIDKGNATGVEDLNSIVVLLFNDSDFFNTANAIAINHGKRHYIFGDAKLLVTPMIFLHELGHSFKLTHANGSIQKCGSMYNIMHESNIGCSAGFTARQLALMSIDKYIGPSEEIYYPDSGPCLCRNTFNYFSTDVEEYLNSIDRNIDDTPLVGSHDIFGSQYLRDIDEHSGTFRGHYEEEYKRYFGSPVNNNYVNDRLDSHLRLRTNNRNRWLNHNRESVGLPMVPLALLGNPDSLALIYKEYDDRVKGQFVCNERNVSCDSKLACLTEENSALKKKRRILSSSVDQLDNINEINAATIDSLNNQIRELIALVRSMKNESSDKDNLIILEKELKKLKYGAPKLYKNKKQ